MEIHQVKKRKNQKKTEKNRTET